MDGARTLVRNGLMQSNLDANFFQIINLDTSNFQLEHGPESYPAVPDQWIDSYDSGSHQFHSSQPGFSNLAGQLTLTQQAQITRVGQLIAGEWRASPILPGYLPSLDAISSPQGDVSLAGNRLTQLADPLNPLDAVNLETMQQFVNGLNPKGACAAASTGNIASLITLLTIDGYTTQDGDRVLVKDQSVRPWENGIWIAHAGSWTRATDMDQSAEFNNATTFITGGSQNAGQTYFQTVQNPNIVGPPPGPGFPNWILYSTQVNAHAGAGLGQSGSTIFAVPTPGRIFVGSSIDIDNAYIGQTSITTLGTVNTGNWQGSVIAGTYGGTGVANIGKTINLQANFSVGLGVGVPPGVGLAFTLAGNSVLSLPVTGTLATLAGNETFTNKHISASQIDSGVLAVAQGGTGGSTPQTGLNNLLPNQIGLSGYFLSTDGTNALWAKPLISSTYLNVKNPPYLAKGDGATDDSAAIIQAISDAAGGGVYFPQGVYYCANDLAPTGSISLIGDGPSQSVIKGRANNTGAAILKITGTSLIRFLGFDGNLSTALQQVPIRNGITVQGAKDVFINDCKFFNTSGHGIFITNCTDTRIDSCEVTNCAGNGVFATNSPRSFITHSFIHGTADACVSLTGSPYSLIHGNTIAQGSAVTYGVLTTDSDNTAIVSNVIQQCAFGVGVFSGPTRTLNSYGQTIGDNNVLRNYMGGIKVDMAAGFSVSGNSVIDNGGGGNDNNTYTAEPGIVVDPANPGTGYQVGDIIKLTGGTGTAASVLVKKIFAGGALWSSSSQDVAVWPISMGSYSVFPTNSVSTTGGHGTGAKLIYTNTNISAGGSGYVVGQVLKSGGGLNGHPMRVVVTGLSSSNQVSSYDVLDGGSFNGASLPLSLVFTPEATGTGSGFTLLPSFGKRYSQNFNGVFPFGIATMGPMIGGAIGDNMITGVPFGGSAILVQDDVSPRNGRASYLACVGNALKNNANNFMGQTIGSPLDGTYNISSVFANNVTYP